MENVFLTSFKALYHKVYISNDVEFDKLFADFNEPDNDSTFDVLKVQNLCPDKLYPCFVIYVQHLINK